MILSPGDMTHPRHPRMSAIALTREVRALARLEGDGPAGSSFEARPAVQVHRKAHTSEAVNLSIFAFSDMSQIKGLDP